MLPEQLRLTDGTELRQCPLDATKGKILYCSRDGRFTADGHRFQLQRTESYDFSDYRRYKGEDAVRWRQKKAAQDQARRYASALTKEMKSIIDAFAGTHPDGEPDEVKLTVKCLD